MPGGGSLNPSSHQTVDGKMHYVHQAGQQVFKFAVRTMEEVNRVVLDRNKLTAGDLKLFIPHQANVRIIDSTADKLGLRPDQVVKNIHKFGNTTSGTIPLALGDALDDGRLHKGDLVLFSAVGAGYTAGSMLMRWAY
jgi:3-oxoacyl-[acyl-carrier-protein] synthase-3